MAAKRPSLADTMRQVLAPESDPAPALSVMPGKLAVPAERPAGFYAATRAGKKKVTATVDPAMHRDLKMLAAEQGVTTEALLLEAITDLFHKRGKGSRALALRSSE